MHRMDTGHETAHRRGGRRGIGQIVQPYPGAAFGAAIEPPGAEVPLKRRLAEVKFGNLARAHLNDPAAGKARPRG